MNALTFPPLPGVLRRCSPVIVHDDGTRTAPYPPDPPAVFRGVIVSDWMEEPPSTDPVTGVEYPVGGFLVALEDGERTVRWSREVPAWTLSLDLSDPTSVDHLRGWLARLLLRGVRHGVPVGSTWYYAGGCWRLRVAVEKHGGYEMFTFIGRWDYCDYRVPGLSAELPPVEALRLCALHIARERGLLPTIETP